MLTRVVRSAETSTFSILTVAYPIMDATIVYVPGLTLIIA